MKSLLMLDGKFAQYGKNLFDLLLLNFLIIFTSIPIVTIGASITAMHYVLLKKSRGEDIKVIYGYWFSFVQNLKNSTLLWLLYMIFFAFLGIDGMLLKEKAVSLPLAFNALLVFVAIVVLFNQAWCFVLLARYDNTVKDNLKNSLFISIFNYKQTILMIVIQILPIVFVCLSYKFLIWVLLLGFTVPGVMQVKVYGPILEKMEETIE